MRRIIILAALLASTHAHAAPAKSTTRTDEHKSITVTTRTAPPPSVFQFMITRTPPAPRNACDTPTSSAFEIVTRDVVKCVGGVSR